MTKTPEGAPPLPPVDDKDWTRVLQEPCQECGFEPDRVSGREVPAIVSSSIARWQVVLARPGAADRRLPSVWSPLEYGCHVRDVFRIFADRVRLMLSEPNPTFANWDQDATAIEQRYWLQDPAVVTVELAAAGRDLIVVFDSVQDDQWSRSGLRSNGSAFTVDSIGRYMTHDIVHHLMDVAG